MDISPIIAKIEQKNGSWILSLKEPLKKDYPVGTVIRNQRHGAAISLHNCEKRAGGLA